jgi:hypothetical protein
VYLRHNIVDLETSVDEMVLANRKLVQAAELEVAEVRSAMKKEAKKESGGRNRIRSFTRIDRNPE